MPLIPPLTVAVPLLGAAVLAATGSHLPRRWVRTAALATAAATTCLQLAQLLQSWPHPLVHWFGNWTPQHGSAVGIVFAVDPLNSALAATVGALMVAALAFSWSHVYDDAGHLFFVLMLAFLAGMSGFTVSADLFDIFVFFELMSVSGYALCSYRNGSSPVIQGSLNFAVLNSIGAFCILMGITLIYGRTGVLNLAQIGTKLAGHRPDGLVEVSFVLILVGFLIKAGAVPFHFWLSDAYAVAAAPVGALYAGIMSDLGYHAIATIYAHSYAAVLGGSVLPDVRGLFIGVGVVTAVGGAVMCFVEADTKRQLAFLVISQGGVFFCGIGLLNAAGVAGSTLYVISSGLIKGALFLTLGYVVATLGGSDELLLAGRGRHRRDLRTALLFAACGLALAAVPATGTWLSASLIMRAAGQAGYGWLPPVLAAATAVGAGTVLRAAARIFLGLGPRKDPLLTSRQSDEPDEGEPGGSDRYPWLLVPPAVLLVAGVGLGFVPDIAGYAVQAAHAFLDRTGYAAEILHGTTPAAPATVASPPTPALAWVYGGATLVGSLIVAAGGLYWRRLPAAARAAGWRLGGPALRGMKALHSGEVGDYALWFSLGAVVLLAVAASTWR